ncbi:MAG: hypothetical protein C0176_03825 [Mesoaciditoga sp.]|nr:MAG: hypothetical protein C0185_03790 [Mesoaciditoga sp.]PMP79878.1 MAG: hypothetical protein C0176_03825 [Mesoaciditoga sp.]
MKVAGLEYLIVVLARNVATIRAIPLLLWAFTVKVNGSPEYAVICAGEGVTVGGTLGCGKKQLDSTSATTTTDIKSKPSFPFLLMGNPGYSLSTRKHLLYKDFILSKTHSPLRARQRIDY